MSQTFGYDLLGNVNLLGYPSCPAAPVRNQSFGYTNGWLTSIPGLTSGAANPMTYHSNGMVAQLIRSNNVRDTWSNDPNGIPRPAEIKAATAGGTMLWNSGTMGYDGSGNVERSGNAWYEYDSLSRLARATVKAGAQSDGVTHVQSFAYDVFGNLQSTTTDGVQIPTPTSSSTNRLNPPASYDDAGNLTFRNGATYEYDAFDQVKRFDSGGGQEWLYLYTADDERVLSFQLQGGSVNRWTFRDLEGKVLRECHYDRPTVTWQLHRDFVFRESTPFASIDRFGAVQHLHTDHLGTVRLTSDATGQVGGARCHVFYPFGEELPEIYLATQAERLRFTGHERDLGNSSGQADDLDYMHARHYNPLTARFLSTDLISGWPNIPQNWNRYAYVIGNPLKYIDPSGLEFVCTDPQDPSTCTYSESTGVTASGIRATGIGGSVADDPLRPIGPKPLERIRDFLNLDNPLFPCQFASYGVSLDFSGIYPDGRRGGMGVAGVNLQYVPGEGLGVYGYGTPETAESSGFPWDIGVSVTLNGAVGTGVWTGLSIP